MNKQAGLVSMNYSLEDYVEQLIVTSALFDESHAGLLRGSTWANIPGIFKALSHSQLAFIRAS